MKISIIIKAYNEEENIEKCIQSAIRTLKNVGGEVILVDSLSTDNTIELAKKYAIKIIQLRSPGQRSCGIGPQVGYKFSSGDYIFIIDADMTINEDFLSKTIVYLRKKNIAGVSGIINEINLDSFASRLKSKDYKKEKTGEVDYLYGGCIYKRHAIDHVGYLSNPYLYSNEEMDLGYKLIEKGYKLLRLPIISVNHYWDKKNSFLLLIDKWKMKYLQGPGQVLRYNIFNKKLFFKHLIRLRIYVLTILFWIFSFFLFVFISQFKLIWLIFIASFFSIFTLRKKSFIQALYLVLFWQLIALGTILGFLRKPKNIQQFDYQVNVIKNELFN